MSAHSSKSNAPKLKELAKNRLHKIIKIPKDELIAKENTNPQIIKPYKKVQSRMIKTRDKDFKEFNQTNPFNLPQEHRTFSHYKDNVRKKLHCEEEQIQTIRDIDGQFFSVVDGQPRKSTDIKVYMKNIRDITLSKADAGYLKDQILQINTSIDFENNEFKKISKLYSKTVSNFLKFAKNDLEISQEIQKEAQEGEVLLKMQSDELDEIAFRFVKLRNQLLTLYSNFEILSSYRRILNSFSPLAWRLKNDDHFNKELYLKTMLDADEPDFYEASIVSLNATSTLKTIEPLLYFKKPKEVINVFNDLEKRCLGYMGVDAQFSSVKENVLKALSYFKDDLNDNMTEMEEIVNKYKREVKHMETKEDEYKKSFFGILMNFFHDQYASYYASKLFTCTQFVHTQIFQGYEDPKDNITDLMRDLECLYMELNFDLESLDNEVVKTATKEAFENDRNAMKQALHAQRELKEYNTLKKSIEKSFSPPYKKTFLKNKK